MGSVWEINNIACQKQEVKSKVTMTNKDELVGINMYSIADDCVFKM